MHAIFKPVLTPNTNNSSLVRVRVIMTLSLAVTVMVVTPLGSFPQAPLPSRSIKSEVRGFMNLPQQSRVRV